jgi:hypothetical protein
LPLAVAHEWLTQHGQQPVVKFCQPLVNGFVRAAAEMRRDALLSPLELTLVKEP